MSPLASRVLVTVVGLPVVLALVYAGGWWLFALAAIAAVLALPEYALMTGAPGPGTLAAYARAATADARRGRRRPAHPARRRARRPRLDDRRLHDDARVRLRAALGRPDAAVRDGGDRRDGPRRRVDRALPRASDPAARQP